MQSFVVLFYQAKIISTVCAKSAGKTKVSEIHETYNHLCGETVERGATLNVRCIVNTIQFGTFLNKEREIRKLH